MKYLALLFSTLGPLAVLAEPVEIVAVEARMGASGWRFDVTLAHPDTGWAHYADAWEVLDADGRSLGTRTLLHPHETEQPFTRALGDVAIPAGTARVFIRARCSVDGWGAALFEVTL
ncbi:hypothetical protein [Abyssibius alkaniclasticus]|uniref:hypothetical protein n=1 Tax=Abyssibius alkaniclasticus TaxID=2881234 RepID=UPI004059112F